MKIYHFLAYDKNVFILNKVGCAPGNNGEKEEMNQNNIESVQSLGK